MASIGQTVFTTRLLYGPPRPVRVVTAVGEVDRSNEAELFLRLGSTQRSARAYCGTARDEDRSASSTVVVDLRRASFVAAGTVARLSRAAEHSEPSVRLVLDLASPPGRTLARLMSVLGVELDVRHDLVDAVLADVAVLD